MSKKTLLSWSSGKDSAWALHALQSDPDVNLVGLFCTVNKVFGRVAMHGVRVELLRQQAKSAGLPLYLIKIPHPCSDSEYASVMSAFVDSMKNEAIGCFAFGDLFLEDVRRYREDRLAGTGIMPLFPLWGLPTQTLAREMVSGGLKAKITCLDPKRLPGSFAGREYDEAFLNDLPDGIDPCGEYGEFHSFAYAGPMFQDPIITRAGETLTRDGFVFTDLLPVTSVHGYRG
jgi:uncharacterized protein (TIGR00290 family)